MPISDYSTTPANNNATPPNGFPEGMAPSDVNNSARQVMADIRTWYEDAQWIDYGYTPTYVGAAAFSVGGDRTAIYTVGRRVKITDSSTLYGVIATSTFNTPNTDVTVTLDSGSLTIAISAVALGIITPSNNALPDTGVLNNYSATTNPTVNDDTGDGYSVGSRWVNTSTDTLYECLDASAGAAIWRPSDEIKAGGSAGVVIKNSGGTTVATIGPANSTGVTFAGAVNAGSINSLTTQLSVANGGTGSTSLTANNVLLGNGTSALQVVAPGTSGNVLTSNGTTWQSAAPTAGAQFKLGSFSYNVATASGSQAITGVGFQPDMVEFFGVIGATSASVHGHSDGTTEGSIYSQGGATTRTSDTTKAMVFLTSAADAAQADVAMTSDGFTITWTKVNSPTGTATIFYRAYKF